MKQSKRKPEQKWMLDLAAMTQVSITGYAASGAFLGLAYFDYFYHLVAISVILGQLAKAPESTPALSPSAQNQALPKYPTMVGKRPELLP